MNPALPLGKSAVEMIDWLAKLSPLEYDKVRREVAQKLGIQIKTLDDEVKANRNQASASASQLPFPLVEAWPEPVNVSNLLDDTLATLLRYVVMDEEQAIAATLWIAMTWVIDSVHIAPLALITAPEKACGKSQLLTIFGYLVARPLPAANSTASFLFRAIEAWQPTVLIDEADTFIRENDELKGLVNAGHTRANAYVGRTVAVGDSHEPRMFYVWGAKAFAGIALAKHLPDSTMSRGVVIMLRRKLAHESVERLRHADRRGFVSLASQFARFAIDYEAEIRNARPHLPDQLGDRDQDNWEGLLAIAGCAGAEWIARATAAALKLSNAGETAVSTGNELLADIQEVFARKQVTKISTVDLIAALVSDEEAPWATYNRGKPISPRQLARQLANYGIASKTVRMGPHTTPKGFDFAQFTDAFARYLVPPPPDFSHPCNASPAPLPLKATSVSEGAQEICNVGPNPHLGNANPKAEGVSETPSQRNAEATQSPMHGLASCGMVAETPGTGVTESGDDDGPIPDLVF